MILIARLLGSLDAFKVWRSPWRFLATNQAHLGVVSFARSPPEGSSPQLYFSFRLSAIALKT